MNGRKSSDAKSAGQQQRGTSPVPAISQSVALGQRVGNEGLGLLLRSRLLQAKLTVSNPDDLLEQEADRVADQVMRMPDPQQPPLFSTAVTVQRKCHSCEEELQRSDESSGVPTVDAATEHSISSLSGRGDPLPDSVLSFMEPRFNADFSAVRVHTDGHAHELARAVSARAFTVGRNVVFGAGYYAPETDGGRQLLAHELTHVIQQQAGQAQQVRREPDVGVGKFRPARGAGGMAQATESAHAKADVDEKHWRLPQMERCTQTCHFPSTEARRWYTQYFLEYHWQRYTGEPIDSELLKNQVVYYERRFQNTRSKDEVDRIPASAGDMSWVEAALRTPQEIESERVATQKLGEDYARWVNSKDYQILKRPYPERFQQALHASLDAALDEIGEISTDHHESSVAIMPAQQLWDYGVAKELFAQNERRAVYEDVAKRAAGTYEKRYESARFRAHLRDDIGQHATAESVWEFGRAHYLFLASEKARVFGDRAANLVTIEKAEADKRKYERRKFESDQYRNWVAQGEQLSSPAPFVQPFAFGAFGWAIEAAYAGTQTGILVGESYNACVKGEGDCTSSLAQAGVAVATHYALRNGLNPATSVPEAPSSLTTTAERPIVIQTPDRATFAPDVPPQPNLHSDGLAIPPARASTTPASASSGATHAHVPSVDSPDVKVGGFGRDPKDVPPPAPSDRKVSGFARARQSPIVEPNENAVPVPVDNAADTTQKIANEHGVPAASPTDITQKIPTPPPLTPDLKVGGFTRRPERVPPQLVPSNRKVTGFTPERQPNAVPEGPSNPAAVERHDAVPEPVASDTEITQRIPNRPPAQPGTTIEQVGEFKVLGSRQMEGEVLHRRIWGLSHDGGATTAIGPFKRFVERLRADAIAAGAKSLKISGEMVANLNVLRLRRFVEVLHGTVRQIDSTTIEINIPLGDP
jgi:hypothetical protein